MFIQTLLTNPNMYFMQIFLVTFSICCHEYSHARCALWQGDRTAADAGHLTLNPIKQMGPFSLGMLFILGISWGQVPVNPRMMKHKYSDMLVSFAGPFANLILFILFSIGLGIVLTLEGSENAMKLFYFGGMLNFVLFVLNMLPLPILDGGHILSHFFPKAFSSNSEFANGAIILMFFLVFQFISIAYSIGGVCSLFIAHIIKFLLSVVM